MQLQDIKIAVIGLGYVGLPLAAEFGKTRNVIGFDINDSRINELIKNVDSTKELTKQELTESNLLKYTSQPSDLADSNFYIVTVPTPIDSNKEPDLRPIILATEMIGEYISNNDIIVYESTVYPGVTEEICVPLLEKKSNLSFNKDFFVGYSPERINPGDKDHRLKDIVKVTSGSTPEVAELIDQVYKSIIMAGTFKASSIKVAEAAKVIENTQRDVNIALINELSKIFNILDINTKEVLEAASTKWNFLPFAPGLVGGHCIGVDPYYLTHKASAHGYEPEVILAGRRLNDGMGQYVANNLLKTIKKNNTSEDHIKILIMGLTFKENCPDLRNSKVFDIINELYRQKITIDVYDPWVNQLPESSEFQFIADQDLSIGMYDGIIVAVAHEEFSKMGIKKIRSFGKTDHILYDLKNIFSAEDSDLRL